MKTAPSFHVKGRMPLHAKVPSSHRDGRVTLRSLIASLAGSLLCQCASKKTDGYIPAPPKNGFQKLLRRPALSMSLPSGSGCAWILQDGDDSIWEGDTMEKYESTFDGQGTGPWQLVGLALFPFVLLRATAGRAAHKQPSAADLQKARVISRGRHGETEWTDQYLSAFNLAARQHGASPVRLVPPSPPQNAPAYSRTYAYPDLAGTGVDSVIELHLSCLLEGTHTLRPVLHTHCKVLRPGAPQILWEASFDTKSREAHTLREWVKDSGTRFHATIQTLPQQAAQQLVTALYS
ncbi:hypothetical protein [Prosthecobacter sp.]|uniref:hypothetical protein n=1 Tax=Prosthecobacter sp. TaxID=1965333 RepID=UPI0037849D47